MIRRTASALLLIWMIGFLWFAIFPPRAAGPVKTDAVVVLTGSEGRIDRALEVLQAKLAARMLVSGVDHEVKPREFAAQYHVSMALLTCCVTLGYDRSIPAATRAKRWHGLQSITSSRCGWSRRTGTCAVPRWILPRWRQRA
jgi:hypothetical protein